MVTSVGTVRILPRRAGGTSVASAAVRIPSGGPALPRPRPVRLLGLTAVRDEAANLPGLLANLAPKVDGIVALDDGSTDGSADLLAEHPKVIELLRNPSDRPEWDERGNIRAVVEAAAGHAPGWLLWVDADERLERDFRRRCELVITRGRPFGYSAYNLRLRDLWDDPGQYRADGVWGRKRAPRLWRHRDDHEFDERPLHGVKVPLQAWNGGRIPTADLELYHLRMIRAEDREARRRRYERIDPDADWQPEHGYAYLTDPAGLRLKPVKPGRDYR